jgi:hypothetical protein
VQQRAFFLDVCNRLTLAQLRTQIAATLNGGGEGEGVAEEDLILSLLDRGIGIANSGKGNINLGTTSFITFYL